MKKLTRQDILGPKLYAPIRDDFRKQIIERKKRRRVTVGDRVELVFDNRDTLRFHIEEILRVESLLDEGHIQHELDLANAMLPTETELSATLFLPTPSGEDARTNLHRFIGIDEHVVLVIGDHRVRAAFEPGRQEADRISAVQYTRYPLTPEAKAALQTPGTKLAIEIDHPSYQHRAELSEETRASLAKDLEP